MTRLRARCRGCSRQLDGEDYCYGGRAYVPHPPHASPRRPHQEAKHNYYGGFVCSRACDWRASLEQEQSMPGHGYGQREPGCYRPGELDRKWSDAR